MMRGTGVTSGRCLKFINDVFFASTEMAMSSAIEALTTYEEKCK